METFPYSGADIIILFDHLDSTDASECTAAFARLLWIAGLRLNYTVRTVADCLDAHKHSLELAASLLDRRFLAGDAALHERLESRLPAVLSKHTHEIARHLSQAARQQHARYASTCHHLEPDVKEFPGGLRDLRLIDRLTKLAGEPARSPLVSESAGVIWSARCFLHYRARSDQNVLDFANQEALAGQAFTGGKTPAEWMREYFRRARVIFTEARRALDAAERSQSSLLESIREQRTRLSNAEFTVSRERVLLRTPSQFETDPSMVLRLLEFIGRHGIPPAPETERRLEAVRGPFATWCAPPQPLWPALKSVLACPHAAMALRTLENCALLPALFPEWSAIEDLPVADPEQRYTADQYTLAAVESVDALRTTTDPARRSFSVLLSELEDPTILLLALLFHYMPKRNEAAALARIGTAERDRNDVQFLIDHQRDLADAITSRDVDDPATARMLAAQAGTVEKLKALTVFTYATISARNPEAMTPWRLERLWQAYSATRDELTRELETDRIQQAPADLSGSADFLKGFPVRYLRSHTAAETAAHLRLYEQSRPTGVAVELDEIKGGYRLTVVGRDRPSLFASFAGAISSFGLDILKAEAFANAGHIILDTFVFADPKRMLQLNPQEVERLLDLIRRVALGRTDAQRLLRNRPPETKTRSSPPQVRFDSEACETATLVEIIAEDRPGLLYSLASVFSSSGCNIDVVLIDTKGRRAIDVFYVAHDGHKMSPELQERLREKLTAAC
jgi:[protein-PII] uridylyltransferase